MIVHSFTELAMQSPVFYRQFRALFVSSNEGKPIGNLSDCLLVHSHSGRPAALSLFDKVATSPTCRRVCQRDSRTPPRRTSRFRPGLGPESSCAYLTALCGSRLPTDDFRATSISAVLTMVLAKTEFDEHPGVTLLALFLGFLFGFVGIQASGVTDVCSAFFGYLERCLTLTSQ